MSNISLGYLPALEEGRTVTKCSPSVCAMKILLALGICCELLTAVYTLTGGYRIQIGFRKLWFSEQKNVKYACFHSMNTQWIWSIWFTIYTEANEYSTGCKIDGHWTNQHL